VAVADASANAVPYNDAIEPRAIPGLEPAALTIPPLLIEGFPRAGVTVKMTGIVTGAFEADARIVTLALYVPADMPAAEAATFTAPEFVPLPGVTLSQAAVETAFHWRFPPPPFVTTTICVAAVWPAEVENVRVFLSTPTLGSGIDGFEMTCDKRLPAES
jgi:hypothetical protein